MDYQTAIARAIDSFTNEDGEIDVAAVFEAGLDDDTDGVDVNVHSRRAYDTLSVLQAAYPVTSPQLAVAVLTLVASLAGLSERVSDDKEEFTNYINMCVEAGCLSEERLDRIESALRAVGQNL